MEDVLLKLTWSVPEEMKEVCKGKVYRYTEYTYFGKKGEFVSGYKLSPLKRLSCPGCENCFWIEDDIQEGIFSNSHYIEINKGVKHNDTVRLTFHEDGRDWETGVVDSWHLVAVKIEES